MAYSVTCNEYPTVDVDGKLICNEWLIVENKFTSLTKQEASELTAAFVFVVSIVIAYKLMQKYLFK